VSWAEHLRQHKRISKADADIQAQVHHFHQGAEPPTVQHLLSLKPGSNTESIVPNEDPSP
jgi:hypothetical protein